MSPTHSESESGDSLAQVRQKLLAAALPQVPFEGWSARVLAAAAQEAGTDPGLVRLAFPRGGLDLLVFFHQSLDHEMAERLAEHPPEGRFRDRITAAVRLRMELGEANREAVYRGAALFSLPIHATEGMRALWSTADRIWTALGDTSQDYNRYTKRITLAAVLGATAARWLADESEGAAESWAFLDRRIENVMRFEKVKAKFLPFAGCARNLWQRSGRHPEPPGAAEPVEFFQPR